MTFGAPLGLLSLLALAPIVAAYFLRRKQPPRVVSALFLWKAPQQRAEAGPKLERFSRETSLALETLAVLCAALFLADAHCGASAQRTHVVVVVDGGLSMLARSNGTSAAERVKTAIAALAREQNAGLLTIIESGPRPSIIAGPQQAVDRALATLEAWQPAQPAHDYNATFAMAKEQSNGTQPIFFFSDGPLPENGTWPTQLEGHSVGVSADNLAFLSAQRRDEGRTAAPTGAKEGAASSKQHATVTVRVGNFSLKPRTVTVHLEASDDTPQDQTVELPASGTAVVRAHFVTSQPVLASLPDDALPDDGHLTLLPSPLAEVTVSLLDGLEASTRSAVERFLAVAPAVKLGRAGLLSIGPPGSTARLTLGATGERKSFVGPFFAQKGHPLFEDVQLGGVVWTAGEGIPAGRSLMSMGETVLISEEDDGTLHLNLDLSRSNVQRTVAWPVLLGNLVRLTRLSSPGLPRRHVMLGEDVPVVTTAGSSWYLLGPQRQRRPVLGVGALTLPPLPAVGRWVLVRDDQPSDSLEVLPLDPRESDLRDRGPWQVSPQTVSRFDGLTTTSPRAFWPIAALLLLLLADFALTARFAPRPQP
jgi:hypothetical protein